MWMFSRADFESWCLIKFFLHVFTCEGGWSKPVWLNFLAIIIIYLRQQCLPSNTTAAIVLSSSAMFLRRLLQFFIYSEADIIGKLIYKKLEFGPQYSWSSLFSEHIASSCNELNDMNNRKKIYDALFFFHEFSCYPTRAYCCHEFPSKIRLQTIYLFLDNALCSCRNCLL